MAGFVSSTYIYIYIYIYTVFWGSEARGFTVSLKLVQDQVLVLIAVIRSAPTGIFSEVCYEFCLCPLSGPGTPDYPYRMASYMP